MTRMVTVDTTHGKIGFWTIAKHTVLIKEKNICPIVIDSPFLYDTKYPNSATLNRIKSSIRLLGALNQSLN